MESLQTTPDLAGGLWSPADCCQSKSPLQASKAELHSPAGNSSLQSGHGAAGIKSDRSSRFTFLLHFAEDVIRRLAPSDGW